MALAPRFALEIDRTVPPRAGHARRFTVPKPRLPWRMRPRAPRDQWGVECGGRIKRWSYDPGPQVRAAWFAKHCGPRQAARSFDPGGPEAGTLAGARRAPGLFDWNWGTPFPLTRAEQKAMQEGRARYDPETGTLVEQELRPGRKELVAVDPFFAPPTTPAPENWIDDKLQRLRGTFGPTKFQAPRGLLPYCAKGGFGITCAGPDGEVGWTGGTEPLSAADVARFRDAYCNPGQCQTGGKISPPAGYREFVVKVKPRNPAVRLKASCQQWAVAPPVVTDVPLPPLAVPPLPLPGAPPPPCVPDVILGRDDGPFASGWWIVSRQGTRMLVPNPITCG